MMKSLIMEKKASDVTSKNIVSDEELMDISEMMAECAEEFDDIFISDSDDVAILDLLQSISWNDCCSKSIFNRGNVTLKTNTTFNITELAAVAEAITECAEEFNQHFHVTSEDDASPDLTSTSQREKGEKRKSDEESDNLRNPKKKLMDSEEDIIEEDEELRCSICTELFIRAVTLNCSHTFCKYCIDRWRQHSNQCPICRSKIDSACPTLVIDNMIEKKIDKCTDEVKELRDQIVEERSAPVVAPAVAPAMNVDNEPIIVIDSQVSDEVENDEDEYTGDEDFEGYYFEGLYHPIYYFMFGDYVHPFHFARRPYYGGYGRCYVCNQRGHWAPGCPLRLRRFK